jgi:hypothetical protein
VPDVLTRVGDHPGRRRLHPEDPQEAVRGHLQEPDERIGDARQPVERNGKRDRQRLGLLQRDRLRDELADDDREVGQDRERDQERHGVRQRRLHEPRQQRLADGTEQDREDRDPDLHGRDEADRVVHQAERRLRAPSATLGTFLQARSPPRDEGVLGRHEHRVPQNEQEHDDESQRSAHAPSGAPVLGGFSSPTMIRRQYR